MNFGSNLARKKVSNSYLYINFLIQLGPQLCSNLIKCHVLIGTDSTSKVGTKSAALKVTQINIFKTLDQMITWKQNFKILRNI